jgi:hypothetical protein
MELWAERYDRQPDRATFYDWLARDRFPGNLINFLRLCACLDADPVTIIRLEGLNGASLPDSLLHKALAGVGGRGIRASDVVALFGPMVAWPATTQIAEAFGRDWVRREFENPGGRSAYQALRISFPDDARPRALHFAYRAKRATHWRVYGFVECDVGSTRLVNFFGRTQRVEAGAADGITIETYFGEGACSFRVASLHPFGLSLLTVPADRAALRFEA